ncbi:Uncharacterized protein OBRU01_16501, partial [Operophtera brumata]
MTSLVPVMSLSGCPDLTDLLDPSQSRPQTPSRNNRPRTPRSLPSSQPLTPVALSRPTTPRLPSRPSTPAHLAPHHGTPGSRPNTPQSSTNTRPTTPICCSASRPGLEVFDTLQSMRDRMSHMGVSGCGEGHPQELVLFNVVLGVQNQAVLEVFDTLQSMRDRMSHMGVTGCGEGHPQELVLFNVADWTAEEVAQLCHDAAASSATERAADIINTTVPIGKYGLELCEALREIKSRAVDAVDNVTQLSRRACRERGALFAVGESLVREIARLRQDIEARPGAGVIEEMSGVRAEIETTKALEESRRELQQEKAARTNNKEKLTTTESQLRQAQSLKTGEVASGHLTQQRDALQSQIIEMKENIETLTAHHSSAIQALTNELKETKIAFEEHNLAAEKEKAMKEAVELALVESQNMIDELKTKVTELENNRPNPDLPTEREMDLWAELQATKDTLHIAEDDVAACRREKVRFLETLSKITVSEGKIGMQEKLAAELLNKEEILGKMQMQIRDLTKNIKLNEQKVIQYEQYVRNLQAHNRAVANCWETPNGISYQDLQQEIMDLKMNILEAEHRNDELSERLMQKEQQIEQQDKTSRAQARVIKVNKQIAAKAEEIQELFSTLENKQQQIHRLEKIVLALEEQQRRAQAQRTRHEEKIAALEHELAAGGNRRE